MWEKSYSRTTTVRLNHFYLTQILCAPQDWGRETPRWALAAHGWLWTLMSAWLCHPPAAASCTAHFPAQLQPVAAHTCWELTPFAKQKAFRIEAKKPEATRVYFLPLPTPEKCIYLRGTQILLAFLLCGHFMVFLIYTTNSYSHLFREKASG